MEGLIPYLIDVIKKQQNKSPTRTYRRSFSHSDSSNGRSYHLLLGSSDSFGGSSHRRTRSDILPSVDAAEFSEHRHGKDGFQVSPRDPPPNFLSASSPAAKSEASSSHASHVSRNPNNIRNRKY